MQRMSDRDYQKMMNSPDVQRVLDRKAEAVRDETKRRIKHVTGATADSVVVQQAHRDDGVLVRRIGYDLDVSESGPYYEFGTEDTAPHPNLRAAAKSVRGKR
jgi:HK97 gp10 family phage protein